MGKTLKYVSEFSFPSDKGYSGSSGQQMVKGYARGGSCDMAKGGMKPMKKADGGAVDDPRRPMMDRTVKEYIDAINAERAMEMADRMSADRAMQLMRPSRRISQGLRSPRAEMARERAIMGEDAGYKKGGMAMRKQYPADNGKPLISGPQAAPSPKADMLYSKKEVNATNLLRDGKGAPMPHPKGSVNMKHGGMAHDGMAKGGMTGKQQAKVGKVMREFKAGDLHSGKNGPVVKSRKQAIAIGIAEARKAKK